MGEGTSAAALRVRSRTQRFAEAITRHRRPIACVLAVSTLFFAFPLAGTLASLFGVAWPGPRLEVDSRAQDRFPDHPYLRAQESFEPVFGRVETVALVVRVPDGTIYRPDVIDALAAITRELDGEGFDLQSEARERQRATLRQQGVEDPTTIRRELDRAYAPYPVHHERVGSLTHPNTRVFEIAADGTLAVDPVVRGSPRTEAELAALRERVRRHAAQLVGRWVSRDESAALVAAGFVSERMDHQAAVRAVFEHVRGIEARWEAQVPDLEIDVSGAPIARGWVLLHVEEILGLIAASLLVIFGLLWLTFRRWHGVVVPAVAAGTTAVWGLGFAAWSGIHLDPLWLVVPMVITARAVSHTVQMAERFFEVYAEERPRTEDTRLARDRAATRALADLLVPGTLGVLTDVAGLAVIGLTTIRQLQDLAWLGGFWVAAIVVTVEILHPVLLCFLPPPRRAEYTSPVWLGYGLARFGRIATHPLGRFAVAGTSLVVCVVSAWVVATGSQIGEAAPGTPLLWPDHDFNRATAALAERFGGVDSLEVYLDGDRPHASVDPAALHAIEALEEALARDSALSGSVSIAPAIAELWQRQHHGDPKWRFVPDDPGTTRSLIFQLRQNAPPGSMRSVLSDDGRDARAVFRYRDHRGATIHRAIIAAEAAIAASAPGELQLRLERRSGATDAGFFDRERLLDGLYYAIGPLLPTRAHDLRVSVRGSDASDTVGTTASGDAQPEWLEEFRVAALDAANLAPERWPVALRDWGAEDVDGWWSDPAFGVRAVVVDTDQLIVADARAVDPAPAFRPTQAWTRGVQFVLAGGSLGTLAAINAEVERSHLANLSLILVVIFVLHALTYRSAWSGGILAFQLATVTLASLAFMAVRGVGLNLHTLPVQAIGVGLGVDYAIYIVDRVRLEVAAGLDEDAAIRRALSTTGVAIGLTAMTIVAGVGVWAFASLRFQAEMAALLALLMGLHMLGALTVVPALYSILRPRSASALR
ncbi:MAG: MMPL family transporter [Myxococcota bacterium]